MAMAYDDFRERERAGWDERAGVYLDTTARATTQAIPALLASVRARAGQKLIDICCGPGFAAGAAAAIGAEADGLDFAPGMVEQAAADFPRCRFFVGDALAIDVPDGTYEAAVCNFGVFHFVEPRDAMAEAFRILAPGGRYAFSQWCALAESDFFRTVFMTLKENADMSDVPPAPDAFTFSDRDHCRETLSAIGFDDFAIAEVPGVLHAPADSFFDFFRRFGVRTSIILSHQDEQTVARIRERLLAALEPYRQGDRLVVPMPSFVVSARKPA
jgi:SAM-dependent methyltransferase